MSSEQIKGGFKRKSFTKIILHFREHAGFHGLTDNEILGRLVFYTYLSDTERNDDGKTRTDIIRAYYFSTPQEKHQILLDFQDKYQLFLAGKEDAFLGNPF